MRQMARGNFLEMVRANDDDSWLDGPMLASELDFHLPQQAKVLTWLWIYDNQVLLVVTEQHFVVAHICPGDIASIEMESVPVGRLRSVKTHTNGFIELDFANPVFYGHPYFHNSTLTIDGDESKDWPPERLRKFLKVLGSVRR